MTDSVYEVELRLKDAKNQESVQHAEYRTTAATPQEAAGELADFLGDSMKGQFKKVDAER